MVSEGHICDVCGKAGTDKTIIEEHEKMPVVELTVGGLYKIKPENWIHESLPVVLVTDEHGINEDHYKTYYHQIFEVSGDPPTIKKSLYNTDIYFDRLVNLLTELSEEEYEVCKNLVQKSGDWDFLTLSRGRLEEIVKNLR